MFVNYHAVTDSLYSFRQVKFLNTCLAHTFQTNHWLLGDSAADLDGHFQVIQDALDHFIRTYQPVIDKLHFGSGTIRRASLGDLIVFITVRDDVIIYELRNRRTQNFLVFYYFRGSKIVLINNIFGTVGDLEQLLEESYEKYSQLLKRMKQIVP